MEDVVQRIQEWLDQRKMTPAELAKALDMNRSSVIHMLSGRNKPSLQFVMKIAEFDSKVDVRELLTGKKTVGAVIKEPKVELVKEKMASPTPPTPSNSTTERLIVLKSDGTYDSFTKEE